VLVAASREVLRTGCGGGLDDFEENLGCLCEIGYRHLSRNSRRLRGAAIERQTGASDDDPGSVDQRQGQWGSRLQCVKRRLGDGLVGKEQIVGDHSTWVLVIALVLGFS
jgi:hypothetical protein